MSLEIKEKFEQFFNGKDKNAGGIELTIILQKSDSNISGKFILKETFPKNSVQSDNEFEIDIKNLPTLIGLLNLANVKLTKAKSILKELKGD